MVSACLIATTVNWDKCNDEAPTPEESDGMEIYDTMDGPSEEEAYLQGMPKMFHLIAGTHPLNFPRRV